ncbi:hypothetical protein F4776DRAFT_668489 [Hypoxylon sp. NC0597]|nr:hypothetical protein F4776DRAFT_668489 [Hypoxylon sp. NC0597]
MRRVTQNPYTTEFHWLEPDFKYRLIQYYSASRTIRITGIGMNANRAEQVIRGTCVEIPGKAENITMSALDIFNPYILSLVVSRKIEVSDMLARWKPGIFLNQTATSLSNERQQFDIHG